MDAFYKIDVEPAKPANPFSRKPDNITDADIIHAQMITGILGLIKERDEIYADPSHLSKDIETVDLDGISIEENYPLDFKKIKRFVRRAAYPYENDTWYFVYPIIHEEVIKTPPFYGKS